MHTDTSPQDLLQRAIDACLKAGADAADARLSRSEGVSVSVLEGKLETIEREENAGLALRALVGKRQAHVSGSDLSLEAVDALAERCAVMAKAAPEDPWCGLAGPEALARDLPALDLSGDEEATPAALESDALAAETAALAVDEVKTIGGCGASWSQAERWVAASNGFSAHRSGVWSSIGIAAVAERDGAMERDYDSWTTRRSADRPGAEEIGRTAGERAAARLGPRKLESRTAAVIYDRRVSASLLGALTGAISGAAIARGVSFLKDKLGERVFSAGVDIVDDPFRPRGLGSRNHDGEGLPVSETKLIEDGVLTQWMLNGPSARQLGLKPNGFASPGFGDPPGVGGSNLYLAAGPDTPETLMRAVGEGLLVTDMFGPSINPNTGDYSVGVAGFWFENGEIAYPVSEVTIAGDLPSMFARLQPASDLEFRGSRDAPSVLIEDMSIAGS
ncbi:MAG: TldD/PmbA family protein [Pseudomonadota bacterium]